MEHEISIGNIVSSIPNSIVIHLFRYSICPTQIWEFFPYFTGNYHNHYQLFCANSHRQTYQLSVAMQTLPLMVRQP